MLIEACLEQLTHEVRTLGYRTVAIPRTIAQEFPCGHSPYVVTGFVSILEGGEVEQNFIYTATVGSLCLPSSQLLYICLYIVLPFVVSLRRGSHGSEIFALTVVLLTVGVSDHESDKHSFLFPIDSCLSWPVCSAELSNDL
jgi:hypothetical protein